MRVLFFEILLIFRKEYGAPWQLMKLYWGWHLYNFYFFIYLFFFFLASACGFNKTKYVAVKVI